MGFQKTIIGRIDKTNATRNIAGDMLLNSLKVFNKSLAI